MKIIVGQAHGNQAFAERIRQIRALPDPVAYIHDVLRKVRRRQKPDDSQLEREEWFSRYRSSDGTTLSTKEAKSLASATQGWARDVSEIQDLELTIRLWIRYPKVFWEGSPNKNIILKGIDIFRRLATISPIVRKLTSIIVSEEVERVQVINNLSQQTTEKEKVRPSCMPSPKFCPWNCTDRPCKSSLARWVG
jgi:hypothetical protein